MRSCPIESAEEIRSILSNPDWKVRPPGNEVPPGLHGSLAGEVFSNFARMSDGDDHHRRKERVVILIDGLDLDSIPRITRDVIGRLHPATPLDLQFLVPGMVVAALLDVQESHQKQLVEQVRALVVSSRVSANHNDCVLAVNAMKQAVPVIAQELELSEREDIEAIACRLSLIFQASDACAALIGNALVMLAASSDPSVADAEKIVRDSMHTRVPVRSTTRFSESGSTVLNLESAHSQQPNAAWTFGFGPHACPARFIAVAIGIACLEAVIDSPPFDLSTIRNSGWEELPNVWIPKLTLEKETP